MDLFSKINQVSQGLMRQNGQTLFATMEDKAVSMSDRLNETISQSLDALVALAQADVGEPVDKLTAQVLKSMPSFTICDGNGEVFEFLNEGLGYITCNGAAIVENLDSTPEWVSSTVRSSTGVTVELEELMGYSIDALSMNKVASVALDTIAAGRSSFTEVTAALNMAVGSSSGAVREYANQILSAYDEQAPVESVKSALNVMSGFITTAKKDPAATRVTFSDTDYSVRNSVAVPILNAIGGITTLIGALVSFFAPIVGGAIIGAGYLVNKVVEVTSNLGTDASFNENCDAPTYAPPTGQINWTIPSDARVWFTDAPASVESGLLKVRRPFSTVYMWQDGDQLLTEDYTNVMYYFPDYNPLNLWSRDDQCPSFAFYMTPTDEYKRVSAIVNPNLPSTNMAATSVINVCQYWGSPLTNAIWNDMDDETRRLTVLQNMVCRLLDFMGPGDNYGVRFTDQHDTGVIYPVHPFITQALTGLAMYKGGNVPSWNVLSGINMVHRKAAPYSLLCLPWYTGAWTGSTTIKYTKLNPCLLGLEYQFSTVSLVSAMNQGLIQFSSRAVMGKGSAMIYPPQYAKASLIRLAIIAGVAVAAFAAFKVTQKLMTARSNRMLTAKYAQVQAAHDAYTADPTNKEKWKAYKKQYKKYNRLAKFTGNAVLNPIDTYLGSSESETALSDTLERINGLDESGRPTDDYGGLTAIYQSITGLK